MLSRRRLQDDDPLAYGKVGPAIRLPLVAAVALLLALPASSGAGAGGDVNGDGLADVVFEDSIESIDNEGATVAFGARDRSAPASRTEPGARGFRIDAGDGETMSEAEVIGDVNGDGLADVIATGYEGLQVIFGKRDSARVTLSDPAFERSGAGLTFESVSTIMTPSAGDFDGDGLADVLHVTETQKTAARVRLGDVAQPLRDGFTVKLAGRVRRYVRPTPMALGDVNGDGRDDLAIAIAQPGGRRDGFEVEEMVFVVWGRRDGRDVTLRQGRRPRSARVVAAGRPAGRAIFHRRKRCWCWVWALGPAGDVDDDGMDDVGILWQDPFSNRRSRLDVVFGSRRSTPATLPGRAGATVTGVDPYGTFAPFGDRDGDGLDDVLLSTRGRPAGMRLIPGARLRGTRSAAGREPSVRGDVGLALPAGDTDGDGMADLLLGRDGFTGNSRYAILYGAVPQPTVAFSEPGPHLTHMPR